MSYRKGTYILISPRGVVYGLYGSPAAAKGVRTSCLKGIGDIYFVSTVDRSIDAGWEPVLELVDAK